MKKRLISYLMAVCLVMSLLPCTVVNAMTAQDGANWALARIGWKIDTDGHYGAQCKDFVNSYCQENWGFTPPGNAKDLINYNYPSGWQKIKNTPDFLPQPGDIAVWTYGSYATYGHCGIIVSANLSTFESVDQNWYNANGTVGSPAARVSHNYNGFWGVIRPPFNSPEPAPEPIHKDENPHVRNGYCTIKNVASGKFMNVYAGSDANYTSVCMWAYDDSTDQHFRLDHKGSGKYKVYAYCSSRGTNRVVDVNRGTDAPAEGDKIQLWTPDDDTSQLYYPYPVGNDEYVFELASKNGYVLAPNGGGDANADGAQLVLQRYTGAAHQKWRFCDNNGQVRNNNVSYTPGYYTVNTNGTRIVRRKAADPFSEVLSGHDINDKETVYVSQVNDFWGYTEHAGIGGWICLDYTKSTVVLESISISSMPDKTSYFVGEKFDTLGLKITANYSNGQKEELSNGFSVSCNIDQPGTKQATVTYKDKTASFDVNVQNVSVLTISVQENNIKKTYTVGDTLDTTGLSLMVGYNNGTTDIIDSGYTTDYDFSSAGTKTVTVSYGGKSTCYDVTVTGASPSEKASVLVSSAECEAGGNAVVYISLSGNNIYDGNMTIQYDSSRLTLTDAKVCDALSGRMVSINKNYDSDKVRVSFSGTDMIKSGEDILRLEFTASGSEGTANIAVSEARLYDLSANMIEATLGTGSINIYPAVASVEISNVQSETVNGVKVLTANTNNDNIICYLAAYNNGKLVECDVQEPENGNIKLSVSDGYQTKFMVWSRSMKPLMNPKTIY